MRKLFGIAALAALVGLTACAKGDDEANTGSDTTTVSGTDTISQPVEVPTTDTIVTDTTVSTDTIEGEAQDTTP